MYYFVSFLLQYIGRDGIVQSVFSYGDVVVRYRNGKILHLNSDCLTKVRSMYRSIPSLSVTPALLAMKVAF